MLITKFKERLKESWEEFNVYLIVRALNLTSGSDTKLMEIKISFTSHEKAPRAIGVLYATLSYYSF